MQRALTKPPESFRDLWALIGLAALALVLAGLALWLFTWSMSPAAGPSAPPSDPMAAISQAAFTDATGVRILRVFSTAGGGMIDVRYQVVDPDKAIIVHDTQNPPKLVNEATGQLIDRPFHDHSSKTQLRAGGTYQEILVNEGGVINPGDLITIFIGSDARLEHVPVQ
jgi:hypothetical protein